MTWSPGPRPAWVTAANRGDITEFRPDPKPFEPEDLMTSARERTGLSNFGANDFVEPLTVICTALEAEAELTRLGRWATQRYLFRLLDERLGLVDHLGADPGAAHEAITSPVIVVGPPRSGTTVLHRLLAAVPANRAPEGWELLYPTAPSEPGTDPDDARITRATDELTFPQRVSGALTRIHPYSARMPKECLSAQAFSLRSEELVSRYHVPDYVDWLQGCDMAPAYRMHRLVLQVLQRGTRAVRWVLKSPVHLQALPELMATYPDARLVLTHREPTEVLASASSLIATLRSAFSDSVDPVEVGRYHLRLYARSLDQLVDHVDGLLEPNIVTHVRHTDLVHDLGATLERVFDELGLTHGPDVAAEVQAERSTIRDDAVGAHRYDPADFGIDPEAMRHRFDRYRDRFLEPT